MFHKSKPAPRPGAPADQLNDLYWLGYLLTGDRERSVQAVIDHLDIHSADNPFFEHWMLAWSRKIFIAKVLASARAEVEASAQHTKVRHSASAASKGDGWTPDPVAGKAELEQALLAIDTFPRCAVLLMAFEKLSIEDAATLLDADRELVVKAYAFGLSELTKNLSRIEVPRIMHRTATASTGIVQELTI